MTDFRVVTDIEACRDLWQKAMPTDLITDLWEVRDCFQRHFKNQPHFLVAEDTDGVSGLLPLSWIQESHCYGYFPGETWHGKTWLEQNRVPSRDGLLPALLDHCPSPHRLRYMLPVPGQEEVWGTVDEIGYLFLPPRYEYSMECYFQEFSQKSRKRLTREVERIASRRVRYRHDELSDFEYMTQLSIERFGRDSYFSDPRFMEAFRSLLRYLHGSGRLRVTTVLIEDTPAAVDLGCVYKGTYTLLAGGTHAGHPGVAKLINLHHMRYACEQRLSAVDFLCGDFSWKKLFHLTPRPLYLLSDRPAPISASQETAAETTPLAR